jgi:hypothetical protein
MQSGFAQACYDADSSGQSLAARPPAAAAQVLAASLNCYFFNSNRSKKAGPTP